MISIGAAEAFQAAADYIREHGWQRGEMGEDGGPRCAGGALMSVLAATRGAQVDRFLAQAEVRSLIGQERPAGPVLRRTLMNYNDLVATGPADVIDLFEGLALQYELGRLGAEPAETSAGRMEREVAAALV